MGNRLQGRVALVTGGGRGIGRAISERLYDEGAEIAILGTTESVLKETAEAMEQRGGRAVFWRQCDISDESSVKAAVAKIAEQFGKIDILVNNAAVTIGQFGRERIDRPFYEIDEEVWDANFNINLKSVWMLTKAVYPYMADQKWGRVINIGSSTVYFGRGNAAPYIASKAGLIGLTRSMVYDLGKVNATSNCVSVGLTMTDRMLDAGYDEMAERFIAITPMNRTGNPSDIPGTVLYLASDDSAFVTGQVISVDGGRSMH